MAFLSTLIARGESYTESDAIVVHLIPPAISILFYGFYLPLSLVCMPMVYRRKRAGYKAHLSAMLLLITASTASLIVQYMSGLIESTMTMSLVNDYTVLGIYIFSNVIADALLIYRCYVIWERDRLVVLVPVLGYLCNIVLGILALAYRSTTFVFGFWILAILENVALTLLTAGKIWYINQEAGGILGSAVKTRYNMIAAIILESGFIYSSIVLATSITSMTSQHEVYASCLIAAATQFVGIGPSLIIIRVALGVDTRDVLSSIAIMASMSNHVQTNNNRNNSNNNDKRTRTAQGSLRLRTDSEAIFDMDALLGPDLEDTTDLEAQVIRTVTSRGSRGGSGRHRYASLADDDSSETIEIVSEETNMDTDAHTDPTPGPSPNAQAVEFGGSDLAFVGNMNIGMGISDSPRSSSPEEFNEGESGSKL
ncbi:hypothetical protein BT96DRAFT_264868 [Gymnopus androsaceus JB14]|uniref:Uncharacterized protein n=1 Tax=Gymnopus androsaceus JB14 TaxID=1447944 RepID=A0A6A4H4D7_9AGAR|nr:hypothetical protein BT96DRAFT_264868 [Gymnopus androsaceus JB14]